MRATAVAEARHFWFRGFRFFVLPLLRQATAGLTGARLLDCGCGTGNNLELLARFGSAYGFDLTAAGLEIGRESGRTRLVRASVTAVPFPDEAFDVVTSFDVLYSLEHSDERAAVAEMYRVVKPGGLLLINVAAMESLRGDHSVLSREIRRYNRSTLSALVTAPGSRSSASPTRTRSCSPPCSWREPFNAGRGLAVEERGRSGHPRASRTQSTWP